MNRAIAVIPARGGSKRIPGKNIRPFFGRPMIAYSIETARASGLFERVIVSTDDEQIAQVARGLGAETPFIRPAEISGDHAGTTEVVAHALRWMEIHEGSIASSICCIYATAPFIRAEDLLCAHQVFSTGRWRYVFAATSYAFPIFRAFRDDGPSGLSMFHPEHLRTRSQDLPDALHDAGQFYFGQRDAWLAGEPVFASGSTVVRIPRWRVQDIDTEEDWRRAELMAGYLKVADRGAVADTHQEIE